MRTTLGLPARRRTPAALNSTGPRRALAKWRCKPRRLGHLENAQAPGARPPSGASMRWERLHARVAVVSARLILRRRRATFVFATRGRLGRGQRPFTTRISSNRARGDALLNPSPERWRAAYDAFSPRTRLMRFGVVSPTSKTPLKVGPCAWTRGHGPANQFVADAQGRRRFCSFGGEVPSSRTPARVLVRLRGGADQEGPPRGDVTTSRLGAPGARDFDLEAGSARCWGFWPPRTPT